jgi:hypothetical protein
MKITNLPHALILIVLMCSAMPAAAKRAPVDLLGLTPGMSDRDVEHRLEKLGTCVRGEGRAKQTWKLSDPRYEYLVLRYDEDWRIHWVTVFAREGGRRVRYRDIGDLSLATHTGQHFYGWTISAHPGAGTWNVTARGGDPRYLESVSISTAMRQALIVPAHVEGGEDDD